MQPTPTVSRSDVERVVVRDFPSEDRGEVLAILDQYGEEAWERTGGRDRVQLAALRLAEGNIDALRTQIRYAKLDFRDVIAAAEYPRALTRWSAVAAMSESDRQQTYDADWQDYQAWLRRP